MTRWFIDPVGNIFLLMSFKHLNTPNIVNALDGVEHSLGSDMLQHSSVLFLFDMCLIDPLRWSVARRRDAEFVLSELRLSSFPVSLLGDRVLSFGLPVNTTRTHDVTWLLLRCDYYITVFRSRNNTADTGGKKKILFFVPVRTKIRFQCLLFMRRTILHRLGATTSVQNTCIPMTRMRVKLDYRLMMVEKKNYVFLQQ